MIPDDLEKSKLSDKVRSSQSRKGKENSRSAYLCPTVGLRNNTNNRQINSMSSLEGGENTIILYTVSRSAIIKRCVYKLNYLLIRLTVGVGACRNSPGKRRREWAGHCQFKKTANSVLTNHVPPRPERQQVSSNQLSRGFQFN